VSLLVLNVSVSVSAAACTLIGTNEPPAACTLIGANETPASAKAKATITLIHLLLIVSTVVII
jgi:hypothetical protein